MIHPRVSLHQVAFADRPVAEFLAAARAMGIDQATLAMPLLGGAGDAEAALAATGVRAATLNHALGHPLDRGDGAAAAGLADAIDRAAALGAERLYLLTGGRGALDWEAAAARFARVIDAVRDRAATAGVRLLVENAGAFNADIHIAHTLADVIRLAEIADIGLCVDLHACWAEADLAGLLARAAPRLGLVQVSDYVLGDRSAPCRAVPGDGAVPLARLIGDTLALGYDGPFDLELVGPRIAAEGAAAACARAAAWLSATLDDLGAR